MPAEKTAQTGAEVLRQNFLCNNPSHRTYQCPSKKFRGGISGGLRAELQEVLKRDLQRLTIGTPIILNPVILSRVILKSVRKRNREIEQRLFDVFRKYAGRG